MFAKHSLARIALAFAASLALVFFAAAPAAAQVAKSGQPRGPVGFHGEGQLKDLGDGNMGWFGEFYGIGYTDDGKGFLNNASWYCTGEVSMAGGKTLGAGGLCTITDQDGDKVYLRWQDEKAVPAGQAYNRGTYLAGTGKYKGIQGYYLLKASAMSNGNWSGHIVGGEYKLP